MYRVRSPGGELSDMVNLTGQRTRLSALHALADLVDRNRSLGTRGKRPRRPRQSLQPNSPLPAMLRLPDDQILSSAPRARDRPAPMLTDPNRHIIARGIPRAPERVADLRAWHGVVKALGVRGWSVNLARVESDPGPEKDGGSARAACEGVLR